MGRAVVAVVVACSVAAVAAVAAAALGAPVAAATSGRCPMAEGCTIKGSDGLYVTWDPAKAAPSAVHLSRSIEMPGSTWELGYAGFAIKVGAPGLQLCLSVRPGKALHREYGVELARCGSGQSQRWTVSGTFTFGKRITIESLADRGTCLTVRASGRDRKPKRTALVLERCARGGAAGDQTWST